MKFWFVKYQKFLGSNIPTFQGPEVRGSTPWYQMETFSKINYGKVMKSLIPNIMTSWSSDVLRIDFPVSDQHFLKKKLHWGYEIYNLRYSNLLRSRGSKLLGSNIPTFWDFYLSKFGFPIFNGFEIQLDHLVPCYLRFLLNKYLRPKFWPSNILSLWIYEVLNFQNLGSKIRLAFDWMRLWNLIYFPIPKLWNSSHFPSSEIHPAPKEFKVLTLWTSK